MHVKWYSTSSFLQVSIWKRVLNCLGWLFLFQTKLWYQLSKDTQKSLSEHCCVSLPIGLWSQCLLTTYLPSTEALISIQPVQWEYPQDGAPDQAMGSTPLSLSHDGTWFHRISQQLYALNWSIQSIYCAK